MNNNLKFSVYTAARLCLCAGLLLSGRVNAMMPSKMAQSSQSFSSWFSYFNPFSWGASAKADQDETARTIKKMQELTEKRLAALAEYSGLALHETKNPLVDLKFARALFDDATFQGNEVAQKQAFELALGVLRTFEQDAACFVSVSSSAGVSDIGRFLDAQRQYIVQEIEPIMRYGRSLRSEEREALMVGIFRGGFFSSTQERLLSQWQNLMSELDAAQCEQDSARQELTKLLQRKTAISEQISVDADDFKPVLGNRKQRRAALRQASETFAQANMQVKEMLDQANVRYASAQGALAIARQNLQQFFDVLKVENFDWLVEAYAQKKQSVQAEQAMIVMDSVMLPRIEEFKASTKAGAYQRLKGEVYSLDGFYAACDAGVAVFEQWLVEAHLVDDMAALKEKVQALLTGTVIRHSAGRGAEIDEATLWLSTFNLSE